jgi:hypothetical protein
MDDDGAHESGLAQAEHRSERAASRHADDDDTRAVGALPASNASNHRSNDRNFAAPLDGGGVEPVPAAPSVCRFLLSR